MLASFGTGEITLVGHSLGGILGTLWSGQDGNRLIRSLVNVEGNLTAADASFSKNAAFAFEQFRGNHKSWRKWFFSEFTEHQILDRSGNRSSINRFYGSLLFARPEAFLANSLEMMEQSRNPKENGETIIGETYRSLVIPKIYLWGMESLSAQTRTFLAGERLLNRGFPGAGHWPMIDASDDFYSALADFLTCEASSCPASVQ
jgi:pimeloyl-ACP methyl ester carboxylesterase